MNKQYEAWCIFNQGDIISPEFPTMEKALNYVNDYYKKEAKNELNKSYKICKLLCENGLWLECLEEYDLNGNEI